MNDKYKSIVKHYESCFDKHGDNHLGVDWPNEKDALIRYKVMLEVISFNSNDVKKNESSLLDFGCGTARLNDFILDQKMDNIEYSGLDISEKFIDASRKKFPLLNFICGDVLDKNFELPIFDYIILNGVFTEKRELTFETMWEFFTDVILSIFSSAKKGIAFNVMSKNVDWEREDLFHVSLDDLTLFLSKNVSRNYIIRNDYGLYEYTVYLYK